MRLKDRTRSIISVLMMTLMSIGCLCISSFAATEIKPETGDATLKVGSQFELPNRVSVPGAKFNITYTKLGAYDGEGDPYTDSTQPNLKNLDISGGDISYVDYNGTGTAGSTGFNAYILSTKNILPSGSEFKHAGEYLYKIKQSSNNNASIDAYMTYSKAEYELHVFVENTETGLRVAGCYVLLTKDASGTTVEKAKVDIDDAGNNTYRTSAFTFNNFYIPTNEQLTISNTVKGSYADLSIGYMFSMIINNPSNVGSQVQKTYYGVVVDGSTMKPTDEGKIEFKSGTTKNFNLKSGEKLVFVDSSYTPSKDNALADTDTKVLPGGLNYSATFTAYTGYQHKGTVTHGGKTENTVTGNVSEALLLNGATYVDDGGNSCVFESNYREPVITGLSNQIAPFFALIMMAIIAIVINNRSRKNVKE